MKVGVVKESFPGEQRVALVPSLLPKLQKLGFEALLERGAGFQAGFRDKEYQDRGARLAESRAEVFAQCDVMIQVRALGANPDVGQSDLELLRQDQLLVAAMEPLLPSDLHQKAAEKGAVTFALELIPRITRAQSMDILSSMATIAGYKAVLLAADALNRMFPMMMTAAGTVTPAKVLIIGAGVAGLQAIATARRNGAVVYGYDVRPVVKEQVESLGAKFVELDLEAEDAQDKGGYAKQMGADFLQRQQELLTQAAAGSDVMICTAAIPGKKAPLIVPRSMVEVMLPGSVIVDLAAERGGNCELTRPGETVDCGGVKILGPVNLPSSVPFHASQMYSRNVANFLTNLVSDGALKVDMEDQITRETLVAQGGVLVNERVRAAQGLGQDVQGVSS